MLSKNRIFILAALISVVILFFISNLTDLYFLNDDNLYIPLSANWNFLYGTSFRPVSDISLFIDYSIWHTNSLGYHLTNFGLHIASTIVLYFYSTRFFKKYSPEHQYSKTCILCILFLFYPFHSEPLYWIIGRGGLLATLFGLCSLYFYLRRNETKYFLLISIVSFLIGAFAYETIWIVPVLIAVTTWIDYKFYAYPRFFFLRDVFIFWFFFILYLFVRGFIIGEIGGSPYGSEQIIKFNILRLLKNYNVLLARAFLPPMKSTLIFFISYVALITVLVTAFIKFHKKAALSTGAYVTAISLFLSFLPVISLGVDSHDTESERFLYMPSVFAIMLIIELLYTGIRRKVILHMVILCLLVAEIIVLWGAAQTYRKSSIIAAASINAASKSGTDQVLYCINTPTQYKGALIFRMGFPEAMKWLTFDSASKKAVILSQREIERPILPYQVNAVSLDSFDYMLNNSEKKLFNRYIDSAISKGFISGKDVLLYWTDSAVFKISD